MKTADIKVDLINHMGSDLSVVNAARVSFDKESNWAAIVNYEEGNDYLMHDRDIKLLKYLADHKHLSPFNHAFLSFRVKAPIFVARQLVKHKFLPWNEVSRRYVDSEPEFYIPSEWRMAAENVKQGSSEETTDTFINPWSFEKSKINDVMMQHLQASTEMYQGLLDSGICAEQARMVLPQNTMTEWIWSGSLGAFADMVRLRIDSHAQKETQLVAQHIHFWLNHLFPHSTAALIKEQQ